MREAEMAWEKINEFHCRGLNCPVCKEAVMNTLKLYGESVRKKCVEASKNWSCPHKFGKCSCGTDQEEIAKAIMGVEV